MICLLQCLRLCSLCCCCTLSAHLCIPGIQPSTSIKDQCFLTYGQSCVPVWCHHLPDDTMEEPKPLTPSLGWACCLWASTALAGGLLALMLQPLLHHSTSWYARPISRPSSLTELAILSILIFQAFRNVSDPGSLTPGIGVGNRWPKVPSNPNHLMSLLLWIPWEYSDNHQGYFCVCC